MRPPIGAGSSTGSITGSGAGGSSYTGSSTTGEAETRCGRGFRGLDQARRRQRGCRRLRGLRLLGAGRRLLRTGLGGRSLGEHVAARQRDAALAREPLDELARHDLFNRAGRALQLDAVRALQQREHFLAARVEKLRDLVNTNCCQINLRNCATFAPTPVPLRAGASPRTAARIRSAVFAPMPWTSDNASTLATRDLLGAVVARRDQPLHRLVADAGDRERRSRIL